MWGGPTSCFQPAAPSPAIGHSGAESYSPCPSMCARPMSLYRMVPGLALLSRVCEPHFSQPRRPHSPTCSLTGRCLGRVGPCLLRAPRVGPCSAPCVGLAHQAALCSDLQELPNHLPQRLLYIPSSKDRGLFPLVFTNLLLPVCVCVGGGLSVFSPNLRLVLSFLQW